MSKPAAPTRLLVVEADDEARTFLRRRFTRLGYEVLAAAEPAEALSLVAANRFDLVLLDLHASGGEGGFDLLRRLRAGHGAVELPILAIADEGAAEDAHEALALGANDCLPRPLQIGVAHARVEMLLGRNGRDAGRIAARKEFELRLETLGDAASRTEAVSAVVAELGHHICAPLNALLGATMVLTQVCRTPEMAADIETIDKAAAAIDLIIVRALGRADRRSRKPKATLRVLLADHDAGSRFTVHELLNDAGTMVELVEAATGLEAAQATDTSFFDLIMVNMDAPEATAGIRAIRRSERENQTRRTPVVAFQAAGLDEGATLQAGADLCMAGPVTAAGLLSTLAEALVREAEDVRAVA